MIPAMGFVLAAGGNTSGQLGDGTTTTRHDYVWIGADDLLTTAVAAGAVHSLALCVDGTVWTWGQNDRGQLGDGTTSDRSLPAPVLEPAVWQDEQVIEYRPIDGVIAVAGGSRHSIALRADGTVLAWGANGHGQLGNGTTTDLGTPGLVGKSKGAPLRDVIAIGAGHASSVALRADGTVWTWGSNENGELGDGTRENRHLPVQVPVTRVVAVAARGTHMLALVGDGSVRAWGSNSHGELGDNTATARVSPVYVKGHAAAGALTDVIAIACGVGFSLALGADGRVWSWGHNNEGQLGDGTAHTRLTPVRVSTESGVLSGITTIAAGANHALAVEGAAARVFGWGWNNAGRLGDGTTIDHPLAVPVTDKHHFGIVAIAAGLMHSLLIRIGADVRTWGANEKGQLGGDAGGSPFVTAPLAKEKLVSFHNHAAAAGGGAHSVLLVPGTPEAADSTKLFAFGANGSGQLGDGGIADQSALVTVLNGSEALSDVKAIAAGERHTLALATDGTIWTWGANDRGQLGIDTTTNQVSPAKVLDPQTERNRPFSNVKAVAARGLMSLALRADGSVWAWGANDRGQLGDGSKADRNRPVHVEGQPFMKGIAAGGDHMLTLRVDGTIWACGAGDRGQLGQGNHNDLLKPVIVHEPEDGSLEPGEAWLTKAIAAGGAHSLGLRSDGTVWAWGANDRGQLGNTSTFDETVPVRVVHGERGSPSLDGVTAIAAGDNHSMSVSANGAVREDGGFVRCWGANEEGQIGDGTTTDRSAAVSAWPEHGPALRAVSSVAAGARHSLAVAPLVFADAERWLRDHMFVRNRIRWEMTDPVPESVAYDNWPAEMQAELKDAIQSLFEGKPLGIADPPPLAYIPADTELAATKLAKDVAWRIFIGHVAQSVVVEATRAVRWRLSDLEHASLRELFDSRFLFTWSASDSVFQIRVEHGDATPGDPVTVYDFLIHKDLVGKTRLETICKVMDWGRRNLTHMRFGLEAGNYVDHWQYPGAPPVKRIIEGTLFLHPDYISDPPRHWTAGCHGTVGFLRAVLRTVNIPVGYAYAAGHGQPHFLHEDLYVPHADSVYSANVQAHPPVPISRLLIDAATREAWFGSNVDYETAKVNIDRLEIALAVEFLSVGLLRRHCKDLETGAAPKDSEVYAALKKYWTLDELLDMDLWGKMNDKLETLGGCSAISEKHWTG
jgi:alpha-tubulin suppressor-like RCC1 family protein